MDDPPGPEENLSPFEDLIARLRAGEQPDSAALRRARAELSARARQNAVRLGAHPKAAKAAVRKLQRDAGRARKTQENRDEQAELGPSPQIAYITQAVVPAISDLTLVSCAVLLPVPRLCYGLACALALLFPPGHSP